MQYHDASKLKALTFQAEKIQIFLTGGWLTLPVSEIFFHVSVVRPWEASTGWSIEMTWMLTRPDKWVLTVFRCRQWDSPGHSTDEIPCTFLPCNWLAGLLLWKTESIMLSKEHIPPATHTTRDWYHQGHREKTVWVALVSGFSYFYIHRFWWH